MEKRGAVILRCLCWTGLFLATPCLATSIALAHPLLFTETTLTIRNDRTFKVDLTVDLDALALGVPQNSNDAELVAIIETMPPDKFKDLISRLTQHFKRRIRIRFDGEPNFFSVSFPDQGTRATTTSEIPTVLGLTARLIGVIPENATNFSFFASRAFSNVHLTVVDEVYGTTTRSVLERGARSELFKLSTLPESNTFTATAKRYLELGFRHIIPSGLDHILFVLGLFFASKHLGPLVRHVTAFTIAHAMTLGLGAFLSVSLSPKIVEPLIALSIVWVAAENILLRTDTYRAPGVFTRKTVIVFLFGLLHGLGFARALTEVGLPKSEWLLALATFNVGIELGQLGVIVISFLATRSIRDRPWYQRRVVIPISGLIAGIGVIWVIERLLP